MFNRIFDYYFWFSQPSTILTNADNYLGYIFAALFILAIVFRATVAFAKNPITQTLFRKFWNLALFTSLSGLVWLAVRYENTPIFGQRYWAGITLVIGIIWLFFILKYLIIEYRVQKKEYDREIIKNKYIPKSR